MKSGKFKRVLITVLCMMLLTGLSPSTVSAAWNNVTYDKDTFGTNGYYNVISQKDYVLVPGAATETEMVLNNADGTRRQVLHIIEVDPSNPDVSIVPGYNQIDKDVTQEANWSHKELTEMAAYYESNLGYNIVGGMNTDLYYDTYAPRILVYNGEDLSVKGKTSPSSSILYVFQEEDGSVSCDVKAYKKAEFDSYLASGRLLHAVSVSFGMVVEDGELVNKTELREGGSSDAARSMVGVKEDGTLVICMNDGRGANNSEGLSGTFEEGEVMLALGCEWAANCDGGGSSTFLTKRAGEETFTMRSVPCDGAQRPTAHGIFVASNVGPTGELDVVDIASDYEYFAPGTEYTFGAEALDTHGYAMDMPENVAWTLSDDTYGTIEDGTFVSNGKKGKVDVQVLVAGEVVGSKTIKIADPEVFKLSATSTVVPYSTAEKVRTITLPIVATIGEDNVYYDDNVVSVSLSNEKAGTLEGFAFTATSDTSVERVDITVTYKDKSLVYAVEFGKGSEVIFDFEDGDKAGFMGFEEAKKWSKENGVNNTLVGSAPLAGQFNEYLSSKTFVATTENGGQVRNGNNALAWKLDNTDAAFASWSYNVLFNTGETIVLRDVENGMKATTLGMWVYIPEGAPGLAFQSQFYVKNADGSYSCKQDHFMFTSAATGKQTNLNSATEADIPESRWVYASIDISKYDYLCTPVATDEGNSRSPSFIRTYVKPTTPAELTFYIDDITLDYSSAVDDRVLPTISNIAYATADTAVTLENGAKIDGNKMAFSANVNDNAALDKTSGKIYVDGVEVNASISGNVLSCKDVQLLSGEHTVTFEVKDELGNPAKVTRTFTVTGDADITVTGHNDSGKTPMAQSIYYVDITAKDLTAVNKVSTQLKLHNANTWETEGAVAANGFDATFDYNEVSGLLTVTVTKEDGKKVTADDNVLVSIPVRVWTYDRYNYVTEKPIPVSEMGNKPVVNVDCEVVYGEVTLEGKAAAPFGGSINVATELTTISSPYHEHDAELTVLNKKPTAKEYGYENRTYCETCASVIDWGTILEPVNHNYELIDGKFVCKDADCEEVYEAGTGIFQMNGEIYYAISNTLIEGWQQIGDDWYYFNPASSSEPYKAAKGKLRWCGINFVMGDDGKLTSGVWDESEYGTRYYNGPNCYRALKGSNVWWQEIDGKTYGFGYDGFRYEGTVILKEGYIASSVVHEFDENGVYIGQNHETGLKEIKGTEYYIVDGTLTYAGVIEIEDNKFMYIGSDFKPLKGTTCTIKKEKTNGLLPAGTYNIDENGYFILKQGFVDGIYYENGQPCHKGLYQNDDGTFCYIGAGGKMLTGAQYIVSGKLNGYFGAKAGVYYFDENGVMRDKEIYEGVYYENGQPFHKGMYQDENGDIYYIRSYGKVTTGAYAITSNRMNGFFDNKSGVYYFDDNGVIRHEEIYNGVYFENGQPFHKGMYQDENGDIYYIRSYGKITTGAEYITANRMNGFFDNKEGVYYFDDNGVIRHEEIYNGVYFENGQPFHKGMYQDENGDIYYIRSYGKITTGAEYITANRMNGFFDNKEGVYYFDDNGVMRHEEIYNGVYFENGQPFYKGMYQDENGNIYYIKSYGKVTTGAYAISGSKMNGFFDNKAGVYYFDDNGVMRHEEIYNGVYFENGQPYHKGVFKDENGDIYYIKSYGKVATGMYTVTEKYTNGIIPAGTYDFGENGKLIAK